jgi:hypothetical protein
MKYHVTPDNRAQFILDYSLIGTTKSFKEEVLDHIKKVVAGRDHVYLLFSGGMDSRFLALTLLELGVDFTAITYSFSPNYDDYNSFASKDFTKRNKIKHELFSIGCFDMWKCFEHYYESKGLIFHNLNAYYTFLAIEKYNKPNCVFLTGQGCEFKIIDKKINFWMFLPLYQTLYPNIYNFLTDRIIFSYLDEPIIKNNWQSNWQDKSFYLQRHRDKLYNSIYPDKLKTVKKTYSELPYMADYFLKTIEEKYGVDPEVFLANPNDGVFVFDVEKYYSGGMNSGN